jgi:hypothetical protein
VGYWFSAYALGLLLHPYKSVREIVRAGQFRALFWTPFIYWICLWGISVILLSVGGGLLGLVGLGEFAKVLLNFFGFLWWWITFFLLFWQILLVYLTWRFRGFRDEEKVNDLG